MSRDAMINAALGTGGGRERLKTPESENVRAGASKDEKIFERLGRLDPSAGS